MDLTSTLTLALALLASLAVGGFLLLQHRHQHLLEKVVQQRGERGCRHSSEGQIEASNWPSIFPARLPAPTA